ncbi:MAG: SpaA isopeptide-forming pilin-related protein [bacterium]|nr:SpaA isopeptide-forming pilin-related protein [bacterium]
MKKLISKMSKILFVSVLVVLSVILNTENVNADASASISLGNAISLPGYIAGVRYNIKTVNGGGYAYCTNIHKTVAHDVSANLVGTMDAGIAYILENGYPNKSFTGDRNKDFYITQGAVWWYLDDVYRTNNLGNGYKSTGSDSYNLRGYVKSLVDGAKVAKNVGYVMPTLNLTTDSTKMTLSSDKKYYVSNVINANAKNITDKYTVRITSAPTGTLITNVNGVNQTKFLPGENFKIKVPASSLEPGKTISVKVEAGAYRKYNKAYKYQPTDSSMQPVTIIYPFSAVVTDTISLNATKEEIKPSVRILKLDKATGNPVAGATLVIRNSQGKVVKKFVSTVEGNKFTTLPAGTYTVQEIEAPAGYKLNSKPVKFTLPNNNSTQVVKVYNEKKETGVIINKVDKVTGNNIAGATLVIKDANKKVIKKFVSTVKGYEIKNLANGTYTVEETIAPAGYKLNTTPVKFTISDKKTRVSVSVYNEPISPIVTINKVDSITLENIAGAEILVTNSKGEEVARFTSTSDSYVLKDLPYGTYTVEEVTAPEGYFLNEEKQTFTIDEKHLSAQITIKDIPKTCENGGKDENECSVEVPNTGNNSTMFSLLGLSIMSLGVGYVYKKNKKASK